MVMGLAPRWIRGAVARRAPRRSISQTPRASQARELPSVSTVNRRCPQALVEGHDDGEQQPEADKAGGPDGEQVQHPTAVRNATHEAADEAAAEHGHAADERLERTFGGEVAEEDTVDVVGERPGPGPRVTRCPGHERPPVEADQGGRGGQLPT